MFKQCDVSFYWAGPTGLPVTGLQLPALFVDYITDDMDFGSLSLWLVQLVESSPGNIVPGGFQSSRVVQGFSNVRRPVIPDKRFLQGASLCLT